MPSISYSNIIPDTWNKETYKEFINELLKLQELSFKDFSKKTIISNYEIIGIRTPILRCIAKEIKKTNIEDFLKAIEPVYFEETLLEGMALSFIKDYDLFIKYFNIFLNHVDNWATCDMSIAKLNIISKNKDKYLSIVNNLLKSTNPNYIRVGVISLLDHYIEDEYIDYILESIDAIDNNEYYVEMGIAWLVCELFIKQRDKTFKYLSNNNLSDFTQNKAISKIRDSYRVSKEDKDLILQFKRKRLNR